MSDIEIIPVNKAPAWVQRIVDEEELLPEELAKAKANGHGVYRSIVAKQGNFVICYDLDTGDATGIIWVV